MARRICQTSTEMQVWQHHFSEPAWKNPANRWSGFWFPYSWFVFPWFFHRSAEQFGYKLASGPTFGRATLVENRTKNIGHDPAIAAPELANRDLFNYHRNRTACGEDFSVLNPDGPSQWGWPWGGCLNMAISHLINVDRWLTMDNSRILFSVNNRWLKLDKCG